jgi:NAD(P)-dependent dehydrogenase (short-subunit alcohol dehydrogenase family)
MQRILVTGGNSGIGFALCKQLVMEHGSHVLLGSRSAEKGRAAVEAILKAAGGKGAVELVVIDVSDDASVVQAAAALKDKAPLDAIVNNAGTGLAHDVDAVAMVNTNLHGVKRVCDAFVPLLVKTGGRIVNVGSGAGPMYVAKQTVELQKRLVSPDIEWPEIVALSVSGLATDPMKGYGTSKALLSSYTMLLARTLPEVYVACLSPGFIETTLTKGMGASLTPEQGTVSLRHCLFTAPKEESGWFYGSDALRSPLHVGRNPGEPVFDGKLPF